MNADELLGHTGLVQSVVNQTMHCLVPGVSDRDDLVQDAWEGALRGSRSFDPDTAAVGTWLFMRARGQVRDRYRAITHQRSIATLQFVPLESPAPEDDAPERQYADEQADDPLECLELKESQTRLTAALKTLSAHERTIITLFYFDELSLEDIGRKIGRTDEAARQAKFRALKKIRTYLEQGDAWRACPTCLRPAKHLHLGLCMNCYQNRRKWQKGAGRRPPMDLPCSGCGVMRERYIEGGHRSYWSKGMCSRCYFRQRRAAKRKAKVA
jgi:RNA polymerase sigma factor (sigma-70 family)